MIVISVDFGGDAEAKHCGRQLAGCKHLLRIHLFVLNASFHWIMSFVGNNGEP